MWGDATPTQTIYINEQAFEVRQNLYDFLLRVRRDSDDYHRRGLWIDAICINQDDIHERGQQVSIMGDIYSRSNGVITWLQGDNKLVEEALVYLREPPTPNQTNKHADDHGTVLHAFLTHPYWKRAWILQEAIRAPNWLIWAGIEATEIIVTQHWQEYHAKLKILRYWDQEVHTFGAILRRRLSRILDTVRPHVPHPEEFGMQFYLLLSLTCEAECMDPRDRVFSMLSLLSEADREALNVVPEYKSTKVELYQHMEERLNSYAHLKGIRESLGLVRSALEIS